MIMTSKLEKTIIALDYPNLDSVMEFVESFDYSTDKHPHYVKVGMELFYHAGAGIIDYLKKKNLKVFLDLKVHDIPNTAYGAIRSLADLGVDILNVHAAGGIEMMQKAKEALQGYDTKLIAVTILTSLDEQALNQELNITSSVQDTVIKYAQNAHQAGLDGVVSSPLEAKLIKEKIDKDFLTVCPGIRFADNQSQDQKRIATPDWALENGCDYIVMGRAITKADDTSAALARLL
jgi:orotidine-5'-phosphate decarboxylase